jgi:NitT/TauT family transport system substrate-binding protein
MKRFAFAAILALVAAPASAQKIKVSYAAPNANFAQYFAAEDKGYFKDEGLDVELVQAGGGQATPALIAGSLHYSGSPSSALSAILRAAPLKVILVGQSKPIYELWSFDPQVTRFEDLKGKMVAITTRGSTDELSLRIYMKNRNLPNDFLTISPMGSEAVRTASLVSGTQQNGVIVRTEKGTLKQAGILDRGRRIVDFHDEITMQTGGLVTTDTELAENRDRAKRLLRAVWKGTLYLMTQREGVADLIRKRQPMLSADALAADVEGGMADVDDDGVIPADAAAKELAVRAEIVGLTPDKAPPPEKVYDFSLIREVVAEIKASGWTPKR